MITLTPSRFSAVFSAVCAASALWLSGCQTEDLPPPAIGASPETVHAALSSPVTASAPAAAAGSSASPAPAAAPVAEQAEPDMAVVDLGPYGSAPIAVAKAIFAFDSPKVVGKVTGGLFNINFGGITIQPGEVPKDFTYALTTELKKAHYNVTDATDELFTDPNAPKARYQLGARVTMVQLDIHVTPGWARPTVHLDGSMTVDWQLYDNQAKAVQKVVSVDVSLHEVDRDIAEVESATLKLYTQAAKRLLATQDFANALRAPAPAAASK